MSLIVAFSTSVLWPWPASLPLHDLHVWITKWDYTWNAYRVVPGSGGTPSEQQSLPLYRVYITLWLSRENPVLPVAKAGESAATAVPRGLLSHPQGSSIAWPPTCSPVLICLWTFGNWANDFSIPPPHSSSSSFLSILFIPFLLLFLLFHPGFILPKLPMCKPGGLPSSLFFHAFCLDIWVKNSISPSDRLRDSDALTSSSFTMLVKDWPAISLMMNCLDLLYISIWACWVPFDHTCWNFLVKYLHVNTVICYCWSSSDFSVIFGL